MISVEMNLDLDSFKTEDVPASFVFEGMESIFKGTKKKQQKAKKTTNHDEPPSLRKTSLCCDEAD